MLQKMNLHLPVTFDITHTHRQKVSNAFVPPYNAN